MTRSPWSRKNRPSNWVPKAHRRGYDGYDPCSSNGYSPLSVALVWQLPLCPNGQEYLWMARSLWGHHQCRRRVGSHDRSHREAASRLHQRLRKCAGGQWSVGTLFQRRHHPWILGQTGRAQGLGRATKNLNRREGGVEGHCSGNASGPRRPRQRSATDNADFVSDCAWPWEKPGLGGNLFSVKQAARNGVVPIFDMTNSRLETHNHTFPLQELGHDLYCFSLDLAGDDNGPELAMQAAANGNLWLRD